MKPSYFFFFLPTVLLCSCTTVKPLKSIITRPTKATANSYVMLCTHTNKKNNIFKITIDKLKKKGITASMNQNSLSATNGTNTITLTYKCDKKLSINSAAFITKLNKNKCEADNDIKTRFAKCLTKKLITTLKLNPTSHQDRIFTTLFPLTTFIAGTNGQPKVENRGNTSVLSFTDIQKNTLKVSFRINK